MFKLYIDRIQEKLFNVLNFRKKYPLTEYILENLRTLVKITQIKIVKIILQHTK